MVVTVCREGSANLRLERQEGLIPIKRTVSMLAPYIEFAVHFKSYSKSFEDLMRFSSSISEEQNECFAVPDF